MIEPETLKPRGAVEKISEQFQICSKESVLLFIDFISAMPKGTFFLAQNTIAKKLSFVLKQLQNDVHYLADKKELVFFLLVVNKKMHKITIYSVRLKWVVDEINVEKRFPQQELQILEEEFKQRKIIYRFNIQELSPENLIMATIREKQQIQGQVSSVHGYRRIVIEPPKQKESSNKKVFIWLFLTNKSYNLMVNLTKHLNGERNINWQHFQLGQKMEHKNLWVVYSQKAWGKIQNAYNQVRNKPAICEAVKFSTQIKVNIERRQHLEEIYKTILPLPGREQGQKVVYTFKNMRKILNQKFDSFANLCFEIFMAQRGLKGVFLSG